MIRNKMILGSCFAVAMSSLAALTAAAQDGEALLAYTDEYRDWRHMKTEFWGEDHALHEDVGGLHHGPERNPL